MKNYLSFGIMLLSFAASHLVRAEMSKQDFENITAAMERFDLEEVENLLKLYPANKQQKHELLEKAKKIRAEERRMKSFFPNPNPGDIALIGVGSWLTFLAVIIAVKELDAREQQNADAKKLNLLAASSAGVFALSGMYVIIKGLSGSIGRMLYNDAEKLQALIEGATTSNDELV